MCEGAQGTKRSILPETGLKSLKGDLEINCNASRVTCSLNAPLCVWIPSLSPPLSCRALTPHIPLFSIRLICVCGRNDDQGVLRRHYPQEGRRRSAQTSGCSVTPPPLSSHTHLHTKSKKLKHVKPKHTQISYKKDKVKYTVLESIIFCLLYFHIPLLVLTCIRSRSC